ncbi:CotH kinase family protein [Sphingobacterium sp. 1.A.5]|uniref:CotH kinase family protein n=1 Tax=Sphingobacterium sp. 1.A.5 TaxID=2044604 RepID=UPI000C0BBD79|nr:CotH kinase family protein [Sphingobacterium sp. 1.A.5]
MKSINYNNKIANNGATPNGIFTAKDANEIKQVVNDNAQEVENDYAKKADLSKVQAEHINVTGTVLPTPTTSGWAILAPNTYTQAGKPNVVVPLNNLGLADYNHTTQLWTLTALVNLPNNSAKISDWSAGAFPKDSVATVNKKIYRANKATSQTPTDTASDWDLIGGGTMDVAGGALSYNMALNGAVTSVIATPNTGTFWRKDGTTGNFGYYTRSAIFELAKGETVRLRSATENLDTPAIVIFDMSNNVIPEEGMSYNALNTPQTFTYTATQPRKIAINYRDGVNAGDFKEVVKFLFLKPSDVDSTTSVNAVASKRSVDELKGNKGLRAIDNLTFGNVGQLLGDGTLKNDERMVRFTEPIAVKQGDDVTLRTRFGDTVSAGTVMGWFLDTNYNYVSNIGTQRRIQPTDPMIKYESEYSPSADGYVVIMSSVGASWENPQCWGEVIVEQPIFLSPSNIGEKSAVGVVSQIEFDQLKNNGGTNVLPFGIFSNIGIMRPLEGAHGGVFSMRYTNPIPLASGQTIHALVAPEYYTETFLQALAIVYAGDMTTEIAVIRASKEGLNSINYEAKENCFIVFNHNVSGYLFDSKVEIVLPKLFAPYGEGGGGGGTGKNIPDVTRYNPVELIKVELTTTDPIPSAKGTFMRGNSIITIDGRVHNFYTRYEVQGSSSAGYPEKNWTIELFTDATMATSKELRLANLLPHSEYVFKVNYIEPMHVCNITANRVWEQMIQTRDGFPKRETDQRLLGANGSLSMETGALGHVDGYPAVLYINGVFYGIGNFNIGKKYQNYDLTKDLPAHTQFELGNAVDYTTLGGIELRNPKTKTPEVQTVLDTFTTLCATPLASANTAFRNGFVTNNIVDTYLFLDYFKLVDCISRNFHIMTYNSGGKWQWTPYDLDTWFKSWNGGEIAGTSGRVWDESLNVPANTTEFWKVKVWGVYETEIRSRYKQLRSMGVFSADNIYNVARDISIKFERKLYEQDKAKWTDKSDWSMGLLKLAEWMRARTNYLDGIYGY